MSDDNSDKKYVDESEKRFLHGKGFNILSVHSNKKPILGGSNKVRQHEDLTESVLRAKNWGIIHSTDTVNRYILVDVDKPGIIPDQYRDKIMKCVYKVRRKWDADTGEWKNSYHGIFEITDKCTQTQIKEITREFIKAGVLELFFLGPRYMVWGGSYDTGEGDGDGGMSEWYFLDAIKEKEFRSGKIAKCSMESLRILMSGIYHSAGISVKNSDQLMMTVKNNNETEKEKEGTKVEKKGVDIYEIPDEHEANDKFCSIAYKMACEGRVEREIIVHLTGLNLQRKYPHDPKKIPIFARTGIEKARKKMEEEAVLLKDGDNPLWAIYVDPKNPVAGSAKCAEYLQGRYKFGRIGMDGELLVKMGNVYLPEGRELVHRLMAQRFPDSSQAQRNTIVKHLGDLNPYKASDFDADPLVLNCLNGLVNLQTGNMIEDDSYLSMMQIATEYRPELGKSTLFEDGIRAAIPEYADQYLDFLCSTLCRHAIKVGKLLISFGDTRRGKSTNTLAFRDMVGGEKFSDVDLVKLENDRFKVHRLANKWGNIATDMKNGVLSDTSNVKKLVFYEPVDAEAKGVDSYTLIFTGRIIVTCNKLPVLEDYSGALFNRIILIPWEGKQHTIDSAYQESLHTPEEKSRILNSAIKRCQKILRRGWVVKDVPTAETRALWEDHSDTIGGFMRDRCRVEDETMLGFKTIKAPTLERTHVEYVEYCAVDALVPVSKHMLGKRLRSRGWYESTGTGVRKWTNMFLLVRSTGQ